MKVTAKEEAGMLVMGYLAQLEKDGPVSLKKIAEESDISLAYLEKVVPSLRKAGLIHSERGVKGGYSLGRPSEEINVAEVLRALSGDILLNQCAGTGLDNPCTKKDTCPIHPLWDILYNRMEDLLE
ncbi:MAG: Rrf2 family transcriptional regulator, partial [Anaerolineaceae bacterium]|nr:Rrf2 family transcriptional regulator [Anaerolineaceae bacterium]